MTLRPIQTIGLDKLLETSNSFYQETLGYKPEQTFLKKLNDSQEWVKYCNSIGENPDKQGIYSPRNQTAAFPGFIENAPLSLFHEYFGHGLYCEKSLKGQELVNLEKKLLQEEKQYFRGRNFSLEDIKKFRDNNKTYSELKELQKENIGIYEGFAVFTEYLLSDKFNMKELFEKKYEGLSQENKQAVDNIINFKENYGDLASFYNFGLARKPTPERVKKLLEDIMGDEINSVDIGLIFGSKNPYSDVDVYLVSDNIEPFHSDWVDVRVHSRKRFLEGLRNFDIRVTNPLITGTPIKNNKKFSEIKNKIKENPITKEAIEYNFNKYKKYLRDYRNIGLNDKVGKPSEYVKTYLANALALREGKKIFSKDELLDYLKNHTPYRRLSSSESFKELKGGIE